MVLEKYFIHLNETQICYTFKSKFNDGEATMKSIRQI